MDRVIKFQFLYKGTPFSSTNNGFNWHKKVYSLDDFMDNSLYELSDIHGSCELVAKRQFTGLTDKNDVDIYEGDIVKILFTDWPSQSPEGKLSLDEYKDSLTKVFTIAFIEGAFQIGCPCYYSDNLTVYDDIRCGKHGYIEVVGNIHQNPELLKGE